MNATVESVITDEVKALSAATPITIGVMVSVLSLTAIGAWYGSEWSNRLANVEVQQSDDKYDTAEWRKSATENSRMMMRLIDKMDRRIEWIERSQEP